MPSRALVLSVFLVVPGGLLAQDTLFRAGQWGAQFTGGASFVSLGVLKFKSPTRALILDLDLGGSHSEYFANDSIAGITSQAAIGLQIGWRTYRPVADKVVALHSLGLSAGFSHAVSSSPFGGSSSQNGWSAGPFADLGALYFLTPHFGIGATGTLTISYSRSSGESPLGTRTRVWSLGGGTSLRFSATLLF